VFARRIPIIRLPDQTMNNCMGVIVREANLDAVIESRMQTLK
jgi:hypothetical protein